MKRIVLIGTLLVGAVAVVALVVTGCETNSDAAAEGVLTIQPTIAVVTSNSPSASFTASGGTAVYAWSVVNPNIGTVTSSGASAVYSALRLSNNVLVLGENFVVVSDDGGNTASARITQTPLP